MLNLQLIQGLGHWINTNARWSLLSLVNWKIILIYVNLSLKWQNVSVKTSLPNFIIFENNGKAYA